MSAATSCGLATAAVAPPGAGPNGEGPGLHHASPDAVGLLLLVEIWRPS
jgi:hypothetical protein